jgi:endonuclease G
MTKTQKLLLIVFLILLGLGFVLFILYRPDLEEVKTNKGREYKSYPYTKIDEFFPANTANQIVRYTNINLAYDEGSEQAVWVCYLLTKNHLENPVCKRSNRFKSDPNIYSESASPKDYYKTGYDRGHLAPAADMLWSENAMQESFYMSNMSPQKPGFNRGAWKKLEGRVRNIAMIEDSIIIITGPLFLDTIESIGKNGVLVPSHYYKAIIDISSPQLGGVAFIMPNRNTKLPLDKFVVTIDSLERVSGLNLMEPLPNDLERQLESTVDADLMGLIKR